MKVRVWVSPTLAGSMDTGDFVDYEAPTITWHSRSNGSLAILSLDEELKDGPWVLYAPGHWLAIELVEPASPEMLAKIDK
jgi:hypothetical protein